MNKVIINRIGIVLGVIIIAGSIMWSRFLGEQKEAPERKEIIRQNQEVDTLKISNTSVPTTVNIQGVLVAFDKIEIFAEVSGTLEESSRPFKEGSYFPKGSVLIKVEAEEAALNIKSQKSSLMNAITQMMPDLKIDYPESYKHWQVYLEQFDPEDPIKPFPEPVNQQEKYFISSRNLLSQYYSIKSAEERLKKYTIYAPFSGVITEASINSGAVVRTGQKLGELMNPSNYELEATIPLSELEYVKAGNTVNLHSDDIEGEWTGRIRRITDQVNAGTQTVKVFIDVGGKNLKEGMYLKGAVKAIDIQNAFALPRDLLVNQNSVYVFRDSTIDLQEVKVVKITDNTAIIRGLEDGTPLIKEMVPGAFDGMKVKLAGNTKTGERAAEPEASKM